MLMRVPNKFAVDSRDLQILVVDLTDDFRMPEILDGIEPGKWIDWFEGGIGTVLVHSAARFLYF